jgi:platelet-activating factor acetylhydrolase
VSWLLSHGNQLLSRKIIRRIGLAMDAWMWPLRDEPELAKSVEQPLLFINSEAFQTAANLETMKRFTVDADHTERRVVTLKFV